MSTLRKIKIKGSIDVLTGFGYIGASSAFAAIGATDSSVIKDPSLTYPPGFFHCGQDAFLIGLEQSIPK